MPPLPRCSTLAAWALVAAVAAAQPAGWDRPEDLKPARTLSASPTADGNQIVAAAIDRLERRATLAVKVRHRVDLGDEESLGEGEFWQQGVGASRRSRWQMRARAGDDTISLVQVLDSTGRYLWTDRRLGSSRHVTRLDLDPLRRELNNRRDESASAASMTPEQGMLLARGGLSQLLADLQRRYQFTAPRAAAVNDATTWAVVGQWRPNELTRLWYGKPFDPSAPPAFPLDEWPNQLPHHVVVHFGQADLFPYLIEYRSAADAPAATAVNAVASVARPLAQYTLFDVRFAAAIDPQLFVFDAGESDWTDETADVLTGLLPLESAPEAEQTTALRKRTLK